MNYYHVFITKERAHGSNSRLDHSQFTDQALITSAHREEQLGVNITEIQKYTKRRMRTHAPLRARKSAGTDNKNNIGKNSGSTNITTYRHLCSCLFFADDCCFHVCCRSRVVNTSDLSP